MFASAIVHLMYLGIFFGSVFLVTRHFLIRSKVLRAMSANSVDEQALAAINNALIAVNEQCHTYTFTVEQAATFLFHGKPFWLILGNVGAISPGKFGLTWHTNLSFYALADAQQSEWMKENSGVFTSVHVGNPYSVFWTKFSALATSRVFK